MDMQKVFSKVFSWMFVGLMISFGTAFYVSQNTNMLYNIYSNGLVLWISLIEIILVVVLSASINRISSIAAKILFCTYSLTTGLTFSVIFVAYSMQSIIMVFGITSLLFLTLAFLGYKTNVDLTKIGTFLFMTLLGIILVSIVNIFLNNSTMDIILCIVGIIIFMGYVAYDIQKIKKLSYNIDDEDKVAIIGALELYLDFINLFLRLLQIFGKNKD